MPYPLILSHRNLPLVTIPTNALDRILRLVDKLDPQNPAVRVPVASLVASASDGLLVIQTIILPLPHLQRHLIIGTSNRMKPQLTGFPFLPVQCRR